MGDVADDDQAAAGLWDNQVILEGPDKRTVRLEVAKVAIRTAPEVMLTDPKSLAPQLDWWVNWITGELPDVPA